jgi:bifunctional DNase/RNase
MPNELTIHDVEWCRHGHPILVLREQRGPRKLAIAVGTEDAQDLLAECPRASGRFRACALLLATLEAINAELLDVTLAPGDDAVLRAILTLGTTLGPRTVPAQATDGLVLALQCQVPILITDDDFARVCYTGIGRREKGGPVAREERGGVPERDPLAAFRAVVERLDFGDRYHDGHASPPD